MTHEYFEILARQTIESLPPYFKSKLENVDIVIQDYPDSHQLSQVGLKHPYSLFGLYQGVPLTKRGNNYMFIPPDKISIFKRPIQYFYRTPERIRSKIRSVILHEIGHHFGLSESDLAKYHQTC